LISLLSFEIIVITSVAIPSFISRLHRIHRYIRQNGSCKFRCQVALLSTIGKA
jgi:hypothetical protein